MPNTLRLFLTLVLTCTAGLLLAAGDAAFELARQAGDVALVDAKGKPLFVRDAIRSKAVLFVLLPPGDGGDACATARSLAALRFQELLPVAVIHSHRGAAVPACQEAPGVAIYRRPAASDSAPEPIALVIDDSLHVRWRTSAAADGNAWGPIVEGVNAWLQGRQMFEANCGHCHGMDGAQASAPETKSLVGITKKYSGADVLRLGAQFGGVDMTGWSEAKRETLLTYIRGL